MGRECVALLDFGKQQLRPFEMKIKAVLIADFGITIATTGGVGAVRTSANGRAVERSEFQAHARRVKRVNRATARQPGKLAVISVFQPKAELMNTAKHAHCSGTTRLHSCCY